MENGPRKRRKRVFVGFPADDNVLDAYPVFRYQVFLTKTPYGVVDESKNRKKKNWFVKLFSSDDEENLLSTYYCGGSLLTYKAVLTACHCLAEYSHNSKTDSYTYAWPLNVWEDRLYSYIGSNEVKQYSKFLVPQHYIIHEACRELKFGLDFTIMDYGVIVTKETVPDRAPKAAISYVPVYRAREIVDYYYKASQKEYTCLVTGYGVHELQFGYSHGEFKAKEIPANSDHQRWGWRTIMNYVDCLAVHYPREKRRHDPSKPFVFFDYKKDNTVVCMKAAKHEGKNKYKYNLGSGDSGGPISCNNVFFALATGSDFPSENVISFASPVVHAIFLVASEFRNNFDIFCDNWEKHDANFDQYPPDRPFPFPTHPDLNPTPPDIDVRPLSRGSLAPAGNRFLLPSITIIHIAIFTK
ncbi:hypothetical protein GE061_004933 [Apolygus lucorum]|uniref:Peptidase S1 domain-containing protein n=1 Tax=Apolygus lucorum TaxID=248454 RepID=A0A8S9WU84_APOLU|nr:hypothetical protein GE061_004933 [Apolygus lucorum]